MVTICLDPQQYHNRMSVVEELRHTAELGYSHMELSPRADWFFWHRYPKADSAMIAEAVTAQQETGVSIHTLVPVFNWSSPDEQERSEQVRNWRRLLEVADGLGCRLVNSELSGDPNSARQSEAALHRSMGSSPRSSSGTGSRSTSRRTRTTSSSATTRPSTSSRAWTCPGSTTSTAARTPSTCPTARATSPG